MGTLQKEGKTSSNDDRIIQILNLQTQTNPADKNCVSNLDCASLLAQIFSFQWRICKYSLFSGASAMV